MTKSKRQFIKGFTLVEVLISVLIVGLAIAALMVANRSSTTANGEGIDLSTAEFLIEQIREMTAMLPVIDPQQTAPPYNFGNEESLLANYDDVDDFAGKSFCPPIDSSRQSITELAAFTQQITITNVSASNFDQTAANHSTSFYKVTVKILHNSQQISQTSWIRTR